MLFFTSIVCVICCTLFLIPLGITLGKYQIARTLTEPRVTARQVIIYADTFQEAKNIAERSYPGWHAIRARRQDAGKHWHVKIKPAQKRKGYHQPF